MACRFSRVVNRSSISALKSRSTPSFSPAMSKSTFFKVSEPSLSPVRRLTLSRVPSELGAVQSMLPLHSVVAAARMTSCLSSTSRSCRALSQGTLCCTSPDL